MSHAFAKDSRACAACTSWGGERSMAPDNTLVHVARYSVEGDCRTASSQDYRKVTKAYHTCAAWAPLAMLKAHGARPTRTPGHSAAMAGLLAGAPAGRLAEPPAPAPVPVAAAPVVVAEAPDIRCRSTPLEFDKAPPQARVLYAHWHRVKQQRGMPMAREMDTARFRDCVGRICLLERAGGGDDFVYRACGRTIQRRLDQRAVTRTLAACHPAEAAGRLRADLDACLAQGRALCHVVHNDPMVPGARFIELLLPLADETGRPASVLAYRHVPGG